VQTPTPHNPSSIQDDETVFGIDHLDFELPDELIAQHPPEHREDARLMVLRRTSREILHSGIEQLGDWLRPHDLLILNDTKVLPARFLARRRTGGAVPGLFLEEIEAGRWRVLLQGSARLRAGETIAVANSTGDRLELRMERVLRPGEWMVTVTPTGSAEMLLARFGQTPLPPYIRRPPGGGPEEEWDRERYQTVYARRAGAVAAPTAGLHVTAALLESLSARGISHAFVTLHVGVGTFKPISSAALADHQMHEEWFELSAETAEAIHDCRTLGGRVVAVGTTSARVLESTVIPGTNLVSAHTGRTGIFIFPPRKLAVVDALLTNFHLPRSTLLAMIMALAGVEFVREAYRAAVANRYRFFSYGDAMFVE